MNEAAASAEARRRQPAKSLVYLLGQQSLAKITRQRAKPVTLTET